MSYGVLSPSRRPARIRRTVHAALALLLPLGASQASAQTAQQAAQPTAQTVRPQFQLTPSALPVFDPLSGRETVRAGLTGWAASSPRSAIGLSFDLSTPSGTGLMPTLRQPVPTSVDMSLRWRTQFSRSSRLDLAAWRRNGNGADPLGLAGDPVYGTNVEMQFDSLSAFGFRPPQSAVGLQINTGGAALKGNQSLLYYRARF